MAVLVVSSLSDLLEETAVEPPGLLGSLLGPSKQAKPRIALRNGIPPTRSDFQPRNSSKLPGLSRSRREVEGSIDFGVQFRVGMRKVCGVMEAYLREENKFDTAPQWRDYIVADRNTLLNMVVATYSKLMIHDVITHQ